MRRKDAIILTYFAGLITMIFVLSIFLIIIPEDGGYLPKETSLDEIFANLYTFRFLFTKKNIFMTSNDLSDTLESIKSTEYTESNNLNSLTFTGFRYSKFL